MTLLKWLRLAEVVVAGTFLCAIVAVVFLGSAGRYLGHPVIWTDEVAQALFVWTSMLAADLTLQRGGHFRIDLLTGRLPKRVQHVLELATKLTLMVLLCLLVWYGLQLARMTTPRPLPMTGISSGVALAALPVGFFLMLLTLLGQFVAQWRRGSYVHSETRDVV